MIPRKIIVGEVKPLKFFTKKAFHNSNGEKIDFTQQVLPLLKQEMMHAFYEAEMRQSGFEKDLSACADFDEVQQEITEYYEVNPGLDRFDPDTFLAPLTKKKFTNAGAFNKFIFSYLKFYFNETRKGENQSPWSAVTAVWRKATPVFGDLYSFGGPTSDSQRIFDRFYRSLLNRVTFGPPVESAEKIIALIESGILNFELAGHPEIRLDETSGTAVLESKQYNIRRSVQCLVVATA